MKCRRTQSDRNLLSGSATWDIVLGLALIILPKCSFCALAYSGAFALCSGRSFVEPNLFGILLVGALSILTLYGILKNWRDHRTWLSLSLVVLGLGLLLLSYFGTAPTYFHYLGSAGLFTGIWLNGSFYAFKNRIRQLLYKNQIIKQS